MSSPSVVPTHDTIKCKCETHTKLHPTNGVYPPCKYSMDVELFVNSKGDSNYTIKKAPMNDPEKVMEKDGWFIEKTKPFLKANGASKLSWFGHYCSSLHWKVYLDEKFLMEEGCCSYCMEKAPPGLIALWKMHNWDYLQSGDIHDGGMGVYEDEVSCA